MRTDLFAVVTEKEKARSDERAAWRFYDETLRLPLDDDSPLSPVLAARQATYDKLNVQQKQYLSGTLVPLLVARQDELAASDGKNESFGVYNATTWMRILIALSRFESARRTHPNDCLFSTHNQHKSGRPCLAM